MSSNISKEKRQDLLEKIGKIRLFLSANAAENGEDLLAALADIERDVAEKKYGLTFEQHQEEIERLLTETVPVFTEEKELAVQRGGGKDNFLLEGDNLSSLHLLQKTHRGRIKMIYIDPPYNTGNKDFTYSDSLVDGQDGYRHSKWLSFMAARLRLARSLLKKDGVIFVSIDDNEQAALKLLMDDIFGEQNFIANIVVKSNPRGSQSAKEIAGVHEYILLYARDIESAAIIGHPLTGDMLSEYAYTDERGAYRLLGLRQRGGFWRASERPNLYYPFFVSPEDAGISLQEDERHCIAVYPYQPSSGEKGTWRWGREKAERELDALVARSVRRGGELVWDIYQKDYVSSGAAQRRTKARSLWDEKEMNYQNAAAELKKLFGKAVFTYAKPVYLVHRCMEMVGFEDGDWVLDFFAGSGTTGHAVMMENARDGIERRFLLCTNNENNICRDVTYERLVRAMEQEGYFASLRYYRVDYILTAERLYYEYAEELLDHMKELVALENEEQTAALALSEEELDAFTASLEAGNCCRKLYMSCELLPRGEQMAALEAYAVQCHIVPGHYYRELEEG